jgi:hypothetical protein
MRALPVGLIGLCVAVALTAAPGLATAAAPRISIGAVQGEKGSSVSRQLESALCGTFECVPRSEVVTKGKVDLAKMRAGGVAGFVLGAVTAKGSASKLWLALLTTSERPARTWNLPLSSAGSLGPRTLDQLAATLEAELGGGGAGAPAAASATAEAAADVAGASGAAPRATARVALGAIQGDPKSRVSGQLRSELCRRFECVARSQVVTGGKVDFAKMQARRVDGFLFGSVAGKERALWLALLTPAERPAKTWSLPLTGKGVLPGASLEETAREIEELLGSRLPAAGAPAIPPLPRAEAPSPESRPAPAAAGGAAAVTAGATTAGAAGATTAGAAAPTGRAPAPAAMPVTEPERVEPKVKPAAEKPAQDARAAEKQPLVAAELGAFLTGRKLTYQGTPSSSALLGYQADFIGGPWLRVALYPLTRVTDDALAGLGLVASYGISIGLETQMPTGAKVPSQLQTLRAGLEWRWRPVAGSGFALVPAVAYRLQSFTTDPMVAGLPDSHLSGVEGALGVEVPVGIVTILAGGGYVKWFSAGDLVSSAYFAEGRAWAFELEAGVSVRVFGPLSLRAVGGYSLTTYTLDPGSSATYQATGAKDQYLGGRITARGEF